jgi:hypothetical protein
MWGRLAWFLAGVGVAAAAAARLLRRKPPDALSQPEAPEPVAPPEPAVPPEPAPLEPSPEPEQPPAATVEDEEADTRAGDLRRRIEESRLLLDERDEFEGAETPVDEADPEARRRDVHDRAREMVERMRGDEPQA